MFGFIFKVALVALVVVAVFGVVSYRRNLPIAQITAKLSNGEFPDILGKFKHIDTGAVAQNLSTALDNLVTHPERNSPVVLGVKVTNDSLSTVVDVIQQLPTDQLSQLRTAICAMPLPAATPSASPTP